MINNHLQKNDCELGQHFESCRTFKCCPSFDRVAFLVCECELDYPKLSSTMMEWLTIINSHSSRSSSKVVNVSPVDERYCMNAVESSRSFSVLIAGESVLPGRSIKRRYILQGQSASYIVHIKYSLTRTNSKLHLRWTISALSPKHESFSKGLRISARRNRGWSQSFQSYWTDTRTTGLPIGSLLLIGKLVASLKKWPQKSRG